MGEGIYAAASGALAQQLALEVLANNLANAGTVGFKCDTISFRAQFPLPDLSEEEDPVEALAFWPRDAYTELQRTEIDFSGGTLTHTGNALDVALAGEGFFVVETSSGMQYTRSGNFKISQEGTLVTQDGLPVVGQNGPISLNNEEIRIDERGNISAGGVQIDRLRVVNFPQPYPLQKTGATLFQDMDAEGAAFEMPDPVIQQGFLETSNVNVVRIMAQIIETVRAYEAYQKAIQAMDEADSQVINDVGGTA